MGMGASRQTISVKSAVRIVHAGPKVEYIYRPVSAQEMMLKYPRHWITTPQVFSSAVVSQAVVPPEVVLMPGEKFYLVPHHTLRSLIRCQNKKVSHNKTDATSSERAIEIVGLKGRTERKRKARRTRDLARRFSERRPKDVQTRQHRSDMHDVHEEFDQEEESNYLSDREASTSEELMKPRGHTLADYLLASPVTNRNPLPSKEAEKVKHGHGSGKELDGAKIFVAESYCPPSSLRTARSVNEALSNIQMPGFAYQMGSEKMNILCQLKFHSRSSLLGSGQWLLPTAKVDPEPVGAAKPGTELSQIRSPLYQMHRRLLRKARRFRKWTPNLAYLNKTVLLCDTRLRC